MKTYSPRVPKLILAVATPLTLWVLAMGLFHAQTGSQVDGTSPVAALFNLAAAR